MKVVTKTQQFDIDVDKAFASGGEGCIIKLSDKLVAKVYHNGKSSIDEQKLTELSCLPSMFVKPLEVLYHNSRPIGYTMEYLEKGKYEPLDIKVNIGCSAKAIEQLCNGVEEAHKHDIVIGDLNLLNVMINSNDEIKFIDVDSYQTKSFKHSGIVLQEISDKQRNSEISKEADYFSLAVCVFMLCTKVHPFKGMHKVYKNDYVQRMLHKLPIITGLEPDIKVPKMFVKPNDNLVEQFKRIFVNGERFPVKPNGTITTKVANTTTTCNVKHRKISVVPGYKFVTYCENKIVFNYGDRSEVYNLSVKGFFNFEKKICHKDNVVLIPTKNDLFIYDGSSIHSYKNITCLVKFNERVINACINGSIFNVVTENLLYTINLDTNIVRSTNVYGLSFNTRGSLLQTIVNNGQSMSIINSNKIVERLDLTRNRGELTYACRIANGKKEILLFNGNNKEVTTLDNIPNFEFMMNYYVIPEDGYISILNNKLVPLTKVEFSEVDENSIVLFAAAGIIVVNDKDVFLLNT